MAAKSARPVAPSTPGVPGSETPALAEPTTPRTPPPPKPDQRAPASVSPTGNDAGTPAAFNCQSAVYLTTAQGVPLAETDHSLRVGPRGPTLLNDHHLREKLMHFDHERIPERVVHARGAAAHGIFESYGTAAGLSRAAFLAEGAQTRAPGVVIAAGGAAAVRAVVDLLAAHRTWERSR
jgi:catalase